MVRADQRLIPPTDIGSRFVGERQYDALRIDVWGPDAESELVAFAKRLLAWLRHLSAQPWIGAIDSHTDYTLKHHFGIDRHGDAIESPFAVAHVTTPEAATTSITSAIWTDAFTRACGGAEVPLYWGLFYDAQNSHARDDLRGAVLSMALALEVARDINFQRFTASEFVEGIGLVLKAPFDDTDLLKHLSSRLKKIYGRDLRVERPVIWKRVREIYIARHHVAHGREAVYPTGAGLRKLTPEVYREWPPAVRSALLWIENL